MENNKQELKKNLGISTAMATVVGCVIGSGAVSYTHLNRLVKQFDQMKKMMKQIPGMAGGKKRGGFGGLGGLMGGNKFKMPF